METKKILAPTIVAIVTLVILTVGAAYAYFEVNTKTEEFTTRTAEASTPDLGLVSLASGTNLTMDLSLADMMKGDDDIIYYASSTGKTTTETTENIGTVSVSGAGTFKCSYQLTIADNDNSLYDVFQSWENKSTEQIILTVNGTDYDFNEATLFPKTINGTMEGLTEENPQYITAKLKLVNKKDVDQSDLADSNITLSFSIVENSFTCEATD